MKKNTFCVNCGKYGHITKECFEPITSYGIILFHRNNDKNEIINKSFNIKTNTNKNQKIKYLLIRRKDSHNYVEFLIGKYDINNISFLNPFRARNTLPRTPPNNLQRTSTNNIQSYGMNLGIRR